MQPYQWFLIVAAATLLAALLGFLVGRLLRSGEISAERKDAIKRSNAVILGAVYEKVLPFLPNFPYSPKDMVFIGKGFDYLVLDGLSEGELRKIVFLEVKSGSSRLNPNEKMIAAIVAEKAIEWKEYRF
ncbi:MAG: Holliday junction resolvase-like protein [Verrucomicrobiota bacterium]|jgi:predicted Holliday junction resolvase-like endonuclease